MRLIENHLGKLQYPKPSFLVIEKPFVWRCDSVIRFCRRLQRNLSDAQSFPKKAFKWSYVYMSEPKNG